MTITPAVYEELDALAGFNDALGKPVAIHILNWEMTQEGASYREMVEAGLVRRYARPPKGWGSKSFFGAKITPAGRAAIAEYRETQP